MGFHPLNNTASQYTYIRF